MSQQKRTKIVCTIGPSSRHPEVLEKMIRAGMNVARLNFSHGSHDDHASLIATIREVADRVGEPIALLQDLQGPKIRVGDLPLEGVMLVKDAEVVFSTDHSAALPKISVSHAGLHKDVKPGDAILLDDGLLDVRVKEVNGTDIVCVVVTGGLLTSHKGFNLPTASLSIPAITDKDKDDLKFGVSQHVDWVALSFVRTAEDVRELRAFIAQYEKELGIVPEHPILIIAKIEKHEALKNMDEIIEAVDGIMVARGDLGVETPAEHVPTAQKELIARCLDAAKPVIVATQMLDSMIRNPRPTRAEVSDVANAVYDGTDAVMLSGESASGKYPIETVETMARIVSEAEVSTREGVGPHAHVQYPKNVRTAISEAAAILAKDVEAKELLVASFTGAMGRVVSRHRPELLLAVATHSDRVRRQLNLSWGVRPFVIPLCETTLQIAERSFDVMKGRGDVATGDKVVFVSGTPVGISGTGNTITVLEVK